MSAEQRGETSPLLRPQGLSPGLELGPPKLNRTFFIIWITFLIILLDFSVFLSIPAQNAIFEKIICQQYVASLDGAPGGLPPTADPCKSTAVQSELGDILGWSETFQMIPGILVGLPWGMLGDRLGRVPVFFYSVFGIFLVEVGTRVIVYWPEVFPLRGVWYIQLLLIPLGGGATVAQSMVFTFISDITEAAERADSFVILVAGVLAAEIVATPIGGALSEAGHPWIPYLLTPVILAFGTLLIWVLPETLPPRDINSETTVDDVQDGKISVYERLRSVRAGQVLSRFRARLSAAPRALWMNLPIVCLVAIYFVAFLSRQAANFIVLFASKNFSWSIPQASYLLSLRSATNLFVLLVILPFMNRLLINRLKFSPPRKDLILLRSQSFLLVVGALLVAVSAHPPTLIAGLIAFAFGAGFSVNVRSLATMLVSQEHFASLNTALAISQSAGGVTAGPMLAATWKRGLQLGGAWLGLPFFVAAGLFAVVAAVSWAIRLKEEVEGECNEDVEPHIRGFE